jgi:hypothetical protein
MRCGDDRSDMPVDVDAQRRDMPVHRVELGFELGVPFLELADHALAAAEFGLQGGDAERREFGHGRQLIQF